MFVMVMELKPSFLGVRKELLATLPEEDQRAVKALERQARNPNVPEAKRIIFLRELKVLDTDLGRKPENGGYPYPLLDEVKLDDRIQSVLALARGIVFEEDILKAVSEKEAELGSSLKKSPKRSPLAVAARK